MQGKPPCGLPPCEDMPECPAPAGLFRSRPHKRTSRQAGRQPRPFSAARCGGKPARSSLPFSEAPAAASPRCGNTPRPRQAERAFPLSAAMLLPLPPITASPPRPPARTEPPFFPEKRAAQGRPLRQSPPGKTYFPETGSAQSCCAPPSGKTAFASKAPLLRERRQLSAATPCSPRSAGRLPYSGVCSPA